MKRVLAVFGIFVLAVLLFAPAAFAEETPALTARSAPGDNGDISVTFSLGSLPEGTGISYAQIELSLQPGDFSLREDSFPGCRRMRGFWCRRSGIRAAFSCFWSPKMPPLRDLTHSRCFHPAAK